MPRKRHPAVEVKSEPVGTARRSDAVDIAVGERIRIYRLAKRMSQTELGDSIGVTFQQIQKYERGTNRVGAGRLIRIASVLGIPIAALFGNAESGASGEADGASPFAALATPGAVRLVQAYARIERGDMRTALVTLVETLASQK